jgi:hypothetical protein
MSKVKIKARADYSQGWEYVDEQAFDPDEHELYEEGENADSVSSDSVSFASPAAEELADKEGLEAEDFGAAEPSGKTGFTKSDVQALIDS